MDAKSYRPGPPGDAGRQTSSICFTFSLEISTNNNRPGPPGDAGPELPLSTIAISCIKVTI